MEAVESDTLASQLRQARRRGDIDGVLVTAGEAVNRRSLSFEGALITSRALVWTGRLREAKAWLGKADALAGTDIQTAIVAIDRARLEAFDRLDLQATIDVALAVAENIGSRHLSLPVDIAWGCLQLRQIVAAYRDPLVGQFPSPRGVYRSLQRRFAEQSRLDKKHDVAITRADAVRGRWALRAWDVVCRMGRDDGENETVGIALLRKASHLRLMGYPEPVVIEAIAGAEAAYAGSGHRIGLLDAERERLLLAIGRSGASPSGLDDLIRRYEESGYPKGAAQCLMDQTGVWHRSGDITNMLQARAKLKTLTDEMAFGSMRFQEALSSADTASRAGKHSLAVDICNSVLRPGIPRSIEAYLLVVRGSAHSFMKERDRAIEDRRAAIDLLMICEDESTASDVVASLAGDIASTRKEADVDAADQLLAEWRLRDLDRGDHFAALGKLAERAALENLRILGRRQRSASSADSEPLQRATTYLRDAQTELHEAMAANTEVVHAQAYALFGARIAQIWSMLETAQDNRGNIDSAKAVRDRYEAAGMDFETAGQNSIIGSMAINLANATGSLKEFVERVVEGEAALQEALDYYQSKGAMRLQAAQTQQKLGLLYLNVAQRTGSVHQYAPLAERMLGEAAETLDLLRRALSSSDAESELAAKAVFAEETAEVTREALRLNLVLRPDPGKAWAWTVQSKARALSDRLALDATLSPQLHTLIAGNSELEHLVRQESELASRLAAAPLDQRYQIGTELEDHRRRMREHAALRNYVELRTGAPAGEDEFRILAASAPHPFALVDWVSLGDSLFLVVRRSGQEPMTECLPLTLPAIRRWVDTMLSPFSFHQTLSCRPRELFDLEALVQPLDWLTKPGEHLLLCPTGALHALPLHALPMGKGFLWQRNPIAYTPSLAVLSLLRGRDADVGLAGSRVFGDPSGDRPDARRAAEIIAGLLGVSAKFGADVTLSTFSEALKSAALVHFHGHAVYDRKDALSSRLILAGRERLDVRQIFDLGRLRARMLSLGACEAGLAEVRQGDEAFGLVTALLVSGLQAVTAAGWNVDAESSAGFMQHYYAGMLGGKPAILALQSAALAMADEKEVYHWAPFRLYGDPWARIVQGEVS